MKPSCLTCRHSEPAELTELALECRRYPPTTHHTPDGEPFMSFPQVFEGDWCGEYEPTKETT